MWNLFLRSDMISKIHFLSSSSSGCFEQSLRVKISFGTCGDSLSLLLKLLVSRAHTGKSSYFASCARFLVSHCTWRLPRHSVQWNAIELGWWKGATAARWGWTRGRTSDEGKKVTDSRDTHRERRQKEKMQCRRLLNGSMQRGLQIKAVKNQLGLSRLLMRAACLFGQIT